MSVYEMLFPWQKNVVDKFAHRKAFGYFLDMGLGKTVIASASAEVVNATKVLVISVNSKAIESEEEDGWLRWLGKSNIDYELLNKWSKPKQFDVSKNQALLVNYEMTFKRRTKANPNVTAGEVNDTIKAFLDSCKGHKVALILDESHKVKNISSTTTKAINKIRTHLKLITKDNTHTYLLSGTPFTQGYIDLYSQLKMLGYTKNKSEFMENYCVRGEMPGLLSYQQPIVGYKNLDALYRVMGHYGLTMKSEGLPEQVFVNHAGNVTESFTVYTNEKLKHSTLNAYLDKRNLSDFKTMLDTDKQVNNPFYRNLAFPSLEWYAETTGTFWLRARQASIGFQGNTESYEWFDRSRLESIRKFVDENRENYVVFYNFVPELLELYEIFDSLGYKIDVYSGDIKSTHFYDNFEKLSEDERLNSKEKRVILANFASGSVGKNWQLYEHMILASLPVYSNYEQSIKRIHRIGTKDTVFYHTFYQNNWLDKGMIASLEEGTEYTMKMFEADMKVEMIRLEVDRLETVNLFKGETNDN